jgi:hypothetical protein
MMHFSIVSSISWQFQNALNHCTGDANFVYLFNNHTLIRYDDYAILAPICIVPSQCRPAAALIYY